MGSSAMNNTGKILVRVFYLLTSTIYLLAAPGCTAFQTAGIKGAPSADGPYIGFRQQATRREGSNLYRNYIDLGSGWIQGDSVYAPDGSFFHVDTSLPLYEEEPVRFGLATGKNLYFGGINIYGRGDLRYEELYFSANYRANFTLNKFWGDTDKILDLDITTEYPPHAGGLRFFWEEGARGFAVLAASRWIPPEMESLEFELGLSLDWKYIYENEAFQPGLKAGISMRYYFKPERPEVRRLK
jgi:hypothetical protein